MRPPNLSAGAETLPAPNLFIKKIRIRNLLSFGPEAAALSLRPLNVIIGANGSGKSNFLDAISLLQAAPGGIASTVRDGGGISDWRGGEINFAPQSLVQGSKRSSQFRNCRGTCVILWSSPNLGVVSK